MRPSFGNKKYVRTQRAMLSALRVRLGAEQTAARAARTQQPAEGMVPGRTPLAGGGVYRLNRPARRCNIIHQIQLMWRRRQAI
jgi:hypothetical protein